MSIKCKVIIDSNILWKNEIKYPDDIFNSYLIDLVLFKNKYPKLNCVKICVPEVIIEERVTQYVETIAIVCEKTNKNIERLKKLDFKYKKPARSPNVEKKLRKKAEEFLEENKIEILKIPKIKQEVLVERAFKKIKPFGNEGVGFKDTLIWLSILENVKSSSGVDYILCTKNIKDFEEEVIGKEFKKKTKSKFKVFSDVKDVKGYLDEEYILELELQQTYSEIENEIKEKIGTIMVKINSIALKNEKQKITPYSPITAIELADRNSFSAINLEDSHSLITCSSQLNKSKVVGYDFNSMNVNDISLTGGNFYKISIDVNTIEKYQRKEDPFVLSAFSSYSQLTETDKMKTFSLNIFYNRDIKNIDIFFV